MICVRTSRIPVFGIFKLSMQTENIPKKCFNNLLFLAFEFYEFANPMHFNNCKLANRSNLVI